MKTSKIKKITYGLKQTYDITVSNNHNFFCNNHLIHNCGYTGEVKVILFNTTKDPVKILKGQKIAQAVVCPILASNWIEIKEVNSVENKERGDNGFGSTGI